MTTVGYATLDVIPSMKGLRSQLERQSSGDLTAAGRTGGKRFGDAAGREAGTSFRSRMSSSLKGFSPFAGLAVGAGLVAGFRDIVEKASAAEQAVGGVQAVFGEYAAQVVADSEVAAQGLGLSGTAYQELVTLSGALLKNKGLSDFADQARTLVEVGADLAAQFGGPTQQAVDALNAALRGESDPIERYAISLNQTAVNAVLAAKGQDKFTGAALEQAKTQARLQLIMEQSADAQGAFGRESDTLAGKQARLSAQLADMRTEVGERVLPAMAALAGFANDELLPMLESAGGLATDAARAFADLPGPVKATAAAFIALRIAAATGLTAAAASGASQLGSAMVGLRLRTMMAADAFRVARGGVLSFTGNTGRYIAPVGRLSASLQGLRAGALGAGAALRSGLGGAMGLLGGPWGVAMLAGTAVVAKFWHEHQEAKQRIDDMTSSLDAQTGALTENSRETAFKALQDSGVIELARKWGIGLDELTGAYLGNKNALSQVEAQMTSYRAQFPGLGEVTRGNAQAVNTLNLENQKLVGILGQGAGEMSESRQAFRDHAEAMGESTDGNKEAGDSFLSLRDRIRDARDEINKLADAEQKRRVANLADRQDRLALIRQMQATAEEAGNKSEVDDINKRIADAKAAGEQERAALRKRLGEKGSDKGAINAEITKSTQDQAAAVSELTGKLSEYTKTLNPNTKAGQENLEQLYALADQWNNSSESVRNAKGMYDKIRESFIKSAFEMSGNRKRAKALADQLLLLPEKRKTEITTPGMDKAMADLKRMRALVKDMQDQAVRVNVHMDKRLDRMGGRFASGGSIGGTGTGTSDSNLIWASKGEFMQRKAAVDYYGVEFMRRLNALQVPKFASGGPVGGTTTRAPAAAAGVQITVGQIVAHDYRDFMTQMNRRAVAASGGGVNF